MENTSSEVLIGKIEFNEAKRLKALLEERGIRLRLQAEPQACATRSCRITVDVYARPDDLPRLSEFMQEERKKAFDGLEVDFELHNEVFDSEKSEARCPACGASFSTQLKECPDCGLVFVVDSMMSETDESGR